MAYLQVIIRPRRTLLIVLPFEERVRRLLNGILPDSEEEKEELADRLALRPDSD